MSEPERTMVYVRIANEGQRRSAMLTVLLPLKARVVKLVYTQDLKS